MIGRRPRHDVSASHHAAHGVHLVPPARPLLRVTFNRFPPARDDLHAATVQDRVQDAQLLLRVGLQDRRVDIVEAPRDLREAGPELQLHACRTPAACAPQARPENRVLQPAQKGGESGSTTAARRDRTVRPRGTPCHRQTHHLENHPTLPFSRHMQVGSAMDSKPPYVQLQSRKSGDAIVEDVTVRCRDLR